MGKAYVEFPKATADRLTNTSGAIIAQYDFIVLGGKSRIACEAIGIAAIGAFRDIEGDIANVDDFVSGEATFATANLPVYWKPTTGEFSNTAISGYYLVGYGTAAIASGILSVRFIQPVLVDTDVTALAIVVANITSRSGIPFRKTVTITAAAAGTAVEILSALEVGSLKPFITDFLLSVNGETAWTDSSGTILTIQDAADTPVVAVTFAKAQLTSQAQLGKHSTGVTLETTIRTGVGLTAAKAVNLIADSNFDAGSDITVTVVGFLAAA